MKKTKSAKKTGKIKEAGIIDCPAYSELTEEPVEKIRSYIITREIDSSTKHFEAVLKGLKCEFGFDLEKMTFNMGDL